MGTDKVRQYNFIDLFAGAGGMSEGFEQVGFVPIAYIEMDRYAAQTLETRSAWHWLKANHQARSYYEYLRGRLTREQLLEKVPEVCLRKVICETMSEEILPELFGNIDEMLKDMGSSGVDVIIGGPPCQAYSIVGRAQSSHMETPMAEDPRNNLYKLYVKFLAHYRPRMFIFENVMGIESANGGATWSDIKDSMRRAGYEIECKEQNAKDFGVLQNRKRMIIVGWLRESGFSYPQFSKITYSAVVNDLLIDLPKLHPGESSSQYRTSKPDGYIRKTGIRTAADVLTLHESRPNKERDIEIYRKAIELWNNGHKRLNYNDLPEELKTHKNRKSFLDRFKVVEGDEPFCHTMLAHLSKDGHYFIHPDPEQHRSITVREAARIQSFPDNYFFEGPRTSQFIQIGNAVPPMMAKGIAEGIYNELNKGD